MSVAHVPPIASPIHSEIDFERPGKQVGHLRLPHSVHRSAYGWLPIPIASIASTASTGRGDGPAVLVMAGNHGDEYEGQILVSRLIREVAAEHVRGRLILLPMANYPAAQAGLRTSPLDGGNLNRSFPGDPRGTPTQVIADYIERSLLPRVDVVIDLHSGGSSLQYHGATLFAQADPDPVRHRRVLDAVAAFGLPHGVINESPNPVGLLAAARRNGVLGLLTELGGAGTVDTAVLDSAWQGTLHLLGHLGVLEGPLVPPGPPHDTRLLRVDRGRHYVYAYDDGVFEPLVQLGERVEAGQPAARLHTPERPEREPVTVHFPAGGLVICKRVPALTQRGDCLYQLADGLPSTYS
ncbi:succinylglutamate desuccinylase/aspartoacylase family protein [Cupriavidus neocaledonicus]|uniref:N-alpha-acetyl-L-2,4-diaminobutyric acid deacetylase n=1 Tax=Cupriavidus neocaledonicus TaxID=1040979 RepID=A0A375HQP1_9BURK|nr:succinylglutamate desuccinylase/aspartoacylase family protein [Cupriavidus neocaledonicus]SOZ39269.1 Succinylglutamate desuccinylase/aspartoacylase [Cupriavidus neocaledonicus]SPD59060.1 N-alpha-acetyl-L-2,4-diaminobutyric acid deacetylase [Cupriavidus neocaledonicus]